MGAENVPYYKFPIDSDKDNIIREGIKLPINRNKVLNMDTLPNVNVSNSGDYTLGHGYDKKGEYVSLYDKWDLNPFSGVYRVKGLLGDIGNKLFGNKDDLSFGIGNPVRLYDRVYLDDFYGLSEPTHATYLPEVEVIGNKR